MKVSVFRVEQPRGGRGPYGYEFWDELEAMFDAHGNEDGKHPGPRDDEQLGYIDPDEHCGFATREHLDQWFDGYHKALHNTGFIVAKYSVPLSKVRYGKTQLVFQRGDIFPFESEPML